MSNAQHDVLPGWNRADVIYLAECLEGKWGDGMQIGSTDAAARFIRAALAATEPVKAPELVTIALTPDEHREILKQRAHAERNRGDDE